MEEYTVSEHVIVESEDDVCVVAEQSDISQNKKSEQPVLFTLKTGNKLFHFLKAGEKDASKIESLSTVPFIVTKNGDKKIAEASVIF